MSLSELSNVLWRQRQLLDLLLYRMTVEQTLLAGRHVRWLSRATDEVESVLEEMRETELIRALVLEDVRQELGLAAEPSLQEIIDLSPDPWAEIFEEHRRTFLALTDEVQVIAASNRELLGREQRATRELMDELAGLGGRMSSGASNYGMRPGAASPVVLDEAL